MKVKAVKLFSILLNFLERNFQYIDNWPRHFLCFIWWAENLDFRSLELSGCQHTLFLNNQNFFGWSKPEDKIQFLTANPEYALESFFKHSFLNHRMITTCSSPFFLFPSLHWEQIDFGTLRSCFASHIPAAEKLTLFWVNVNEECSLFSKCVHWQMFLCSPLLLCKTKRKDA